MCKDGVNEPVKWECQKGVYKTQNLSVDCKPLSNYVPTYCKVYNSRGVSSHCKHIKGFDMYDQCKVATALRWRQVSKECKVDYINVNGNVIGVNKYVKQLKHNHVKFIRLERQLIVNDSTGIKYYTIVYATKTKASKILLGN